MIFLNNENPYLVGIFFFLIGVVIFLAMREVVCWYFKINKRIQIDIEAEVDRKTIIKLLLEKSEKGDKESKKKKTNFSDKKF